MENEQSLTQNEEKKQISDGVAQIASYVLAYIPSKGLVSYLFPDTGKYPEFFMTMSFFLPLFYAFILFFRYLNRRISK